MRAPDALKLDLCVYTLLPCGWRLWVAGRVRVRWVMCGVRVISRACWDGVGWGAPLGGSRDCSTGPRQQYYTNHNRIHATLSRVTSKTFKKLQFFP